MVHNYLKKFKYHKYLVFLSIMFSRAVVLYAESDEPPTFESLIDIIIRIFGLFLAVSAAALVIMIAYGIIKGSLAAGDPRGLEGAKGTWTYAVYGFLIVVLSFVIVSIIRTFLGLQGTFDLQEFFDKILEAMNSLVDLSTSTSDSGVPNP